MNKIAILLFLFAFLLACNNDEKKQMFSGNPKVIEAKGYIVPKDSMAQPKVILVIENKLKKVPVGRSKVVPHKFKRTPCPIT